MAARLTNSFRLEIDTSAQNCRKLADAGNRASVLAVLKANAFSRNVLAHRPAARPCRADAARHSGKAPFFTHSARTAFAIDSIPLSLTM